MRLDLLLQARYPDFSRSFWKRRIEAGEVRVSGKKLTKASADISEDAVIEVDKHIGLSELLPPTAAWNVLYENEGVMVINKPPYIRVEHLILQQPGWKLAHRLDKDTSGILVLANDERVLDGLQKQWKARTVKKEYTALVKGSLPGEGRIDGRIMRSFKDRKKMAVGFEKEGREAVTEFKVLKKLGGVSLIQAMPLTGRTHQIRVHFSAIHHPIIGDAVYGDKNMNEKFEVCGLRRQFLHASSLTFLHPITQEKVSLKSELPQDLQAVLEIC